MCNLDDMFKELPSIKRNGRINLYALRYAHRSKSDNFAIALPSNQNSDFLRKFCDSLSFYKEFECSKYDPIGKKDNTYEFLSINHISTVWNDMSAMISGSPELKVSPKRELLPAANLTICELEHQGKKYWLGTQQQKTETLFKGKFPFMAAEGKLEPISIHEMLALTFYVDFVVSSDEEKPTIYIFNRSHFEKVFNYYALLKEHVRTKSNVIEEWAFLENPSFIQERVDTGYVFKGLARIIDDTEYIKQVKSTRPRTLKKRLLEKCPNAFSESDFDGDKLQVTKSNLENIIKMLSKGFRYNFFADKAEE